MIKSNKDVPTDVSFACNSSPREAVVLKIALADDSKQLSQACV